ncbi:MAG TPA: type VI secretion system baseplate subunit TssF [Planctomycetota bacterium]|nr:type VI secretion system baseplate subunit TssF [Planctomycetota bacterium]
MFAKYYQDELAWLREMGRELAEARPEMARYLGEPGADPDVERLLEGFAFLTGRIREKLDDEFPELTHGLLDMLCPHYLRPIPSMAILQVKPKPNMQVTGVVLPRGSVVESTPVDGTRCRFRTVADFAPAPVDLVVVEFAMGHPSVLRLRLRPGNRRNVAELAGRALRLHLAGDPAVSRALFVALCHYRQRVVARPTKASTEPMVVNVVARPAGLAEDEAALTLPSGSFRGFRLLQEYFAFPERFLFVDLFGVDAAAVDNNEFELTFEFRALPEAMPPVTATNVLLDCVPIVNLFAHDADPIRAEVGRTEYRVRPSGGDPNHYEVHSVDAVVGRVRGAAEVQKYEPFFSFGAKDRATGRFYQLRRRESMRGAGTEVQLRLGAEDPTQWADLDTISVDLTCSNRDLPTRLGPGDIAKPATETSAVFNYRNIGTPTPPVPPPLGDEVYWRLLAHMTLDLRRLADRDSLCTAMSLYDFRARVDRQARRRLDNLIGAIEAVTLRRGVELLDGVPVNGGEMQMRIAEDKVGGDGEVYLLGTILSEFLAQYVSLNSFSRLQIHCIGHHEEFTWPARIGRKITL